MDFRVRHDFLAHGYTNGYATIETARIVTQWMTANRKLSKTHRLSVNGNGTTICGRQMPATATWARLVVDRDVLAEHLSDGVDSGCIRCGVNQAACSVERCVGVSCKLCGERIMEMALMMRQQRLEVRDLIAYGTPVTFTKVNGLT